MKDQLTIILETFILSILFLGTDVFSFGAKKCRKVMILSVIVVAALTTFVNNLFYQTDMQYFAYIGVLLAMSAIYSYFFIDAPLIYAVSLQLNMFGCFSMVKRIIPSWIRLATHHTDMTTGQEWLFYLLYSLCVVVLCIFFTRHALLPQIVQPVNYWLTMLSIPAIILMLSNITAVGMLRTSFTDSWKAVVMDSLMLVLLLMSHYLSYLNVSSYNDLLGTQILNQQIRMQLSQIERSGALVEQIRRDKHEMKNVYFYIHTMLEENEIDKLKEFVNTHLLHRYDRLEEFHTGNETLDYLLSQKASEARGLGISFLADIRTPLDICMESNDLCAILLNLLDNAIEAGDGIENPDIQVTMMEQKNYLSITVRNRIDRDVLTENPALHTTKEDAANHGIGLRIIHSIVEKYNGMFSTKIQDGYFTANALLQQEKA